MQGWERKSDWCMGRAGAGGGGSSGLKGEEHEVRLGSLGGKQEGLAGEQRSTRSFLGST